LSTFTITGCNGGSDDRLVDLNLVLCIGVIVVIIGMLVAAILADHRADIARTSHAITPAGSDVTAHLPVAFAAVS